LSNPIFQTVAVLAKGMELLAYEMTLLSAEVYTFRKTNKALSKCRRAKKTRVCQKGALTIKDTQDILVQRKQKNRLDVTNVLKKIGKIKGNPLDDSVALAERLVIIYKLIKRL